MIWIVETKLIAVRAPLFYYVTATFMILTPISLETRTTLRAHVRSNDKSRATHRCTVSRSPLNLVNAFHPSASAGGIASQPNWSLVLVFKVFRRHAPHLAGRLQSAAVIISRASIKMMRSLRLQLCLTLAISALRSRRWILFGPWRCLKKIKALLQHLYCPR